MNAVADRNSSIVNGVKIKRLDFQSGLIMLTKKHAYEHQAILAHGELRVSQGERVTNYQAPAVILIPAGDSPFLECVSESAVLFCLQALSHCPDVKEYD